MRLSCPDFSKLFEKLKTRVESLWGLVFRRESGIEADESRDENRGIKKNGRNFIRRYLDIWESNNCCKGMKIGYGNG